MLDRIIRGLVLAIIIGGMDVVPALADGDHDRWRGNDNGRYENRERGYGHERYEHRGRGWYDRDRYENRGRRWYGHGYRGRGYGPPAVYAPPPPPGIGILFPPIFIHP